MGAPAPLLSIPQAPAPPGAQAEWVCGAGGLKIRAALFPPQGQPRGSVLLSPGRIEPIEKYFEVVGELQARGFVVLAQDWRGQGLSQRLCDDPKRGQGGRVDDYLADQRAVLEAFQTRLPRPWIALSHSMGASLTLAALARGETRFSAAILSAPMLGLAAGALPSWVALPVVRAAIALRGSDAYVLRPPPSAADRAFEGNPLTHDRARFDRYLAQQDAATELAMGGVTWGWLDFAYRLIDQLLAPRALAGVQSPVVIVAAGQESIVVTARTRVLAKRLTKGRYLEIPDARHEILMETDPVRAVFWSEFDRLADGLTGPSA